MKFRELQAANITASFSDQINHTLISLDKVASLFITKDPQKDARNVIEAPDLKILGFPNQKKTIAFEPNRFIVAYNDYKADMNSALANDFTKILSMTGIIDQSKLEAYGFNFDALAEAETGKLSDIVGPKLLQFSPDIKRGGATVSFEKDGVTYVVELKSVSEKLYHVHVNVHYQSNSIPPAETIKEEVGKQLIEFQSIIEKI